jgi:hypothetical protein
LLSYSNLLDLALARRVPVSVYRIDRLDPMRFVTVGGFAGTLAARSILSFTPAVDSREELLPVPWTETGCAAEYSGDRHVDPSLTHRIPVSITAAACFEAELHEHRLQLDHQRGRRSPLSQPRRT